MPTIVNGDSTVVVFGTYACYDSYIILCDSQDEAQLDEIAQGLVDQEFKVNILGIGFNDVDDDDDDEEDGDKAKSTADDKRTPLQVTPVCAHVC